MRYVQILIGSRLVFVPFVLFVLLVPALPCSAATTLVQSAELWRYRKGTSAPQADWRTASDSSLDQSWLTGNGGFGYADNTAETAGCKTLLPDMRGAYTTVAMRRTFDVTGPVDPAWHLELVIDYDDGFIAWLDGVFLTSANSPLAPAEPAFNATASASHESSRGGSVANPEVTYDTGPVGTRLAPGPHILSMVGLNQSGSSSDFIQIASLILETNNLPATNCLSGFLTADTLLQATNSPYVVCGNLTVAAGATLQVEPGTTVMFGTGVELTIADDGRLLAEGNETNRIRFTQQPGAGAWGGLTIGGSPGSPETRLAYIDLDGNSRVCIEVAGGTLALDHATFGTTSHPYVALDSSSFLISHCVFPSSSAAFELLHGTGGIKAGGRGIVRDSFFGITSGYNDIMDFTGGNRPDQPIIQYYNNVFSGATDDILDLDGTDAWIEGNIFLHSHKNGAPDSSAAVSGGDSGSATSQITIIRNLFFDCDQAATAKQGNFYVFLNNTIVHMTKTGGLDTADGVVNVRDLDPSPTTFGDGYYFEANVIADATNLVRNYGPQQTTVTLVNNLLPIPWNGPGTNNVIADPLLKHIPLLSETFFTNWTDAQVLWDWLSLQTNSPARRTGPNGVDLGALIPPGVSVSGEPDSPTTETTATLNVGVNRRGNGISPAAWTEGAGFTAYKWQLDNATWSAETPIGQPIQLTNLAPGLHQVAVIGRNDAGTYQNDAALGTNAVVTLSRVWEVPPALMFTGAARTGDEIRLQFLGERGATYTAEFKEALKASDWSKLSDVTADAQTGIGMVSDRVEAAANRFYRLTSLSGSR